MNIIVLDFLGGVTLELLHKKQTIHKFILFFIVILLSMKLFGITLIEVKGEALNSFSAIFISIVLEAVPFILLGSFFSALIQVFVDDGIIKSIIPQNKVVAVFVAALMGLFIPVCECGIIPVVRRLIKKGVPYFVAISFMLACPIINPIVILSTYNAFYDIKTIVFFRIAFGFLVAVTIGLLMWYLEGESDVLIERHEHACSCCHHHHHHGKNSRFFEVLEHTSNEFLDIGKFLILGAVISAFVQTTAIRQFISTYSKNAFISVLAMLIFAYIISLCSEADAFIARTFVEQFTMGSIVGFLILGPMIDIKNTLVLLTSFKKRFAVELIILIFLLCLFVGVFVNTYSFVR